MEDSFNKEKGVYPRDLLLDHLLESQSSIAKKADIIQHLNGDIICSDCTTSCSCHQILCKGCKRGRCNHCNKGLCVDCEEECEDDCGKICTNCYESSD